MSLWTLALQSLRFYWRSHLGVMLGALLSTAVLTGALLVGDCVRATLLHRNLQRLGGVEFALYHPTRFVRQELADALQADLNAPVVPALYVLGMASTDVGKIRANRISVYGIDERFWQLGQEMPPTDAMNSEGVWINEKLAVYLEAKPGDTLILRVEKPSLLSRDSPLSTYEDTGAVLRLPVQGIVDEERMGAFDLRANPTVPWIAYVPLPLLQREVERAGQVNTLLVKRPAEADLPAANVQQSLEKHWTLEDAQLELRTLSGDRLVELRTDRIFLDTPVQRVVKALSQPVNAPDSSVTPIEVLSYLVNRIEINGQSVPYSTVTAIDESAAYPSLQGLQKNEIALNQWTADDLQAQPGDTVKLTYFVLGQGRDLIEKEHIFTLSRVIPMDDPLSDPELMPEYPGISNRENCRDWDPGFAIEIGRIRDQDEKYWDQYKGTPKAYMTLESGQDLWSNRFGNRSAIRFFSPDASKTVHEWLPKWREVLTAHLQPHLFGFAFQPVREIAMRAATESMNFAPLFLGFSFFLIIASLILTALLFLFQIEQRADQTGLLRILGYTPRTVRGLHLMEGFAVACVGSAAGLLAAILYTWLLLVGLSTLWKGAVGGIEFQFALNPQTLWIGFAASVAMTLLALWFGLRRQTRLEVRELLASTGAYQTAFAPKTWDPSQKGLWIFGIGLIASLCIIFLIHSEDAVAAAGKFFGAGALFLIACMGLTHYCIHTLAQYTGNRNLSLPLLGVRNTARRAGRSLTIAALLACGSFLVIAVGANRHDPLAHAQERNSGTGGFAYYGESTLPLLHNLNTEEGAGRYGLSLEDLKGAAFVPIRVRQGDEASCLNLNRAQTPQLMGVPAETLAQMGAFTLASAQKGAEIESGWRLLEMPLEEGVIPAIADQATIQWALGKSLGDRIAYVDEQGNPFRVQLVAALANSIYQGNVLISQENFIRHYPSISGYQALLVDAPQGREKEIAEVLNSALQDIGLQLTPAGERLAAFSAVENTYLSIFQLLGGLGLILGTAGVAVVVLRNVLERRSELALLQAVGFSRAALRRMVVSEYWLLLILGLGSGIASGFLAVLPHLLSRNSEIPYVSLLLISGAMLGLGALWVWVAGAVALRGPLLNSLQDE